MLYSQQKKYIYHCCSDKAHLFAALLEENCLGNAVTLPPIVIIWCFEFVTQKWKLLCMSPVLNIDEYILRFATVRQTSGEVNSMCE